MSHVFSEARALVLAVFGLQRDAKKLQSVIDQFVPKAFRHLSLQGFNLIIIEFDDFSGAKIDQMIVVFLVCQFIAGPPIAKIVTFKNARFIEQPHGPVNRCNADAGIFLRRPPVQFFHIRMIGCFRQHPGDDPPLAGHFHTFFQAQTFNAAGINRHRRPAFCLRLVLQGVAPWER
jgi:hypothetical protein